MSDPNTTQLKLWGNVFSEHREHLLNLAKRNLNPILLRRITPEDIVQMTLEDACRKIEFFENNPEIPPYFKLRTLLFQTITALERKHLQSQKRDAYKEVDLSAKEYTTSGTGAGWECFADSLPGPCTKVAREDRYALLKQALEEMQETDRQILELRHFDGLSNADCASLLKIEPKTASIRYVRALQRLQRQLLELTEFQP